MEQTNTEFTNIPVIDISPLLQSDISLKQLVAQEIHKACRDVGFFYIKGHGVSEELLTNLYNVSKAFFNLPIEEKLKINMELGGRAWRGYFQVGDELTSGKPDKKEGLYLGEELSEDHEKVLTLTPMHGKNLWPEEPKELATIVFEYFKTMKQLGHILMSGIALSLNLPADFFTLNQYTNDPLCLFRLFNYPPPDDGEPSDTWGVGEHTDYGVLTILKQDSLGGLEVKNRNSHWIQAPSIEGTFVINIGDMLEKMTHGLYRSTPHRVKNPAKVNRMSFPFFFDPNFDSAVRPIPLDDTLSQALKTLNVNEERWDRKNVHIFEGTYGEYVLGKVSQVFPQLAQQKEINHTT